MSVGMVLVESLMFSYHPPRRYPGSSLRTRPKGMSMLWNGLSVGFIPRQTDCRAAYLQVETTGESSITGGPATEVDGRTKVGVSGGG